MTTTKQEIDFSVDLTKALLWQHEGNVELASLVKSKDSWYRDKQEAFWSSWVRDVFDIRTCKQFGLIVWSIILNIPLHYEVKGNDDIPFGFGENNVNFENGNFGVYEGDTITLSIEQQRVMLLLRYNQLTGNCSVKWINGMLNRVLGSNYPVYVHGSQDMSYITYVLDFFPSSAMWFVLYQCDVLPRPAGVKMRFIVSGNYSDISSFGFGEYNENFENGNFANPYIEAI